MKKQNGKKDANYYYKLGDYYDKNGLDEFYKWSYKTLKNK